MSNHNSKNSKETAITRLHSMKEVAEKRIPNPTPPDSNKVWENLHNPLSSKGD